MKLLAFKFRVFIYNLFSSEKATHTFFYSKQQQEVIDSDIPFSDFERLAPKGFTTYKGVRYTEMKGFKYGYKSNWDDAVILGFGSDKDIKFESK